MTVACHFYLLNTADRSDSHALYTDGPQAHLITDHPPAVGDLIYLNGATRDPNDADKLVKFDGAYRVVDRGWMPSGYGSINWPYGKERSTSPEWLEVMVVPSPAFFADPDPQV